MKILDEQREFFQSQQTKSLAFRTKALKRLQQEIVAREDQICDALYADFNKPRFETLAAETQFVLAEIKHVLKYLNYWARPERVGASLMNFPSSDWIYKEPYGSVLIIAPWNYPFQLAIAPMIGALAAGNTVVIKPSELTPNTSALLKALIAAVFPPEHATVVEGGVEISQQLLAQKWDYIFFTGSTQVGQIVYESAAKHLTPVTLELGGKNPCIIDKTAKLKLAARRIVWGKFLNAGQTCIAPDYILVEAGVKAQLIQCLQEEITKAYGENPQLSADYTRIVTPKHHQRLLDLLKGEKILFGGQKDSQDRYLAPTLVNEPQAGSAVMEGEIFGPILPIISYKDKSEIEGHIKRYGKPLATYIFSTDRKFQKEILNRYSFGGGAINDTIIQITNKKLPFGGVGPSGIGAYHGKHSFNLFSHHKAVVKKANWLDLPMRYAPYKLSETIAKKIKHLF